MKLHTTGRSYEKTGVRATKQSGIRANAHTMRILSQQYSDLEWAIVREYGTNMLDAYVYALQKRGLLSKDLERVPDNLDELISKAGLQSPVIHVPSKIEPWISFSDFGIGMSFETLWETYTDYGATTKDQTNSQVGGFGIGCKVGLFYEKADQMIVESRKDGERHLVVATRDETDIPEWNHISTSDTTDPNGVTVRLPVSETDFHVFKDRVARLLQYFPMKVKITGDANFHTQYDSAPPEYATRTEKWGLRSKGQAGQYNVIMGNVPYPVEYREIAQHADIDYGLAQRLSIDFYLDVGEVAIVPSREKLMFTERTTSALASAVEDFFSGIRKETEKDIASAPTLWEAMQRLQKSWGIPGIQRYLKGVQWKGIELDPTQGIELRPATLRKKFKDLEIELFYNEAGRSSVSRADVPDEVQKWDAVAGQHNMVPNVERISPHDNVWVFVDDLEKKTVKTVRSWVREKVSYAHSWSGRRQSNGKRATVFVIKGKGVTPEKLSELLGGMPVDYTSNLPAPPTPQRGTRTKTTVKKFREYDSSWVDADIDLNDGGYFVRISRDSPVDVSSLGRLAEVINAAKRAGVLSADDAVYGIPRSRKSVEQMDEWEDLLALVKPKMSHLVGCNAQGIADFETWQKYLNNGMVQWLASVDLRRLPQESAAYRVAKEAREVMEKKDKLQNLMLSARTLEVPIPGKEPTTSGEKLVAEVRNSYPMLAVFDKMRGHYGPSGSDYKRFEDEIVSYIRSVES